jgi:hypothetical protein
VLTVTGGDSVAGTLTSTPRTTFLVQIFSSPPGSAYEGQTLIGSTMVTTLSDGTATFSLTVPLPVGDVVTATATNLSNGDTSEFYF